MILFVSTQNKDSYNRNWLTAITTGTYWNEEEINNLENILGLRQLGLSVKAIIRIKDLHDTKCGSLEQLKENKQVILDEIADRDKQILLLQEQKENLENLLQQINNKLEESQWFYC